MNSRNRAKSLPSLRTEAENQPIFVVTRVPAVPALPSQYRSLTVAKTRTVSSQPSLPSWDREIDVTFHKNLVPSAVDGYYITKAPDNEAKGVVASGVFNTSKSATTRYPESHTYAAIISILNYAEIRKDPRDDNFRRVVNCLYQARGAPVSRNEMCFLFKFPETIRRKIWKLVLTDQPDEVSKPIRLQPFNPFFKDVWTSEGFHSTKDLFASSWGAMSTCYALRAELLASVLTTRRFHLIFSPFVKEVICPQMFHWIDSWGQHMENITIELDLSKLGFGPTPEAGDLLWGDCNIAAGMRRFVSTQSTNRTTPIDSLILLARRYHGLRPTVANNGSPKPYCPPEADFAAAAAIIKLKGRINKLRIAGFNASTTNTIIDSIFPEIDFKNKEELRKHGGMVGTSRIWPLLDGQASIHRDTSFPQDAKPSLPLPRTLEGNMQNKTRNVSKARNQIEKLKDMLEAYEAKKQRSQQVKTQLDYDRDNFEITRCNAPIIPPRSTARLRSNSNTRTATRVGSGMGNTSKEQTDMLKDIKLRERDKLKNEVSATIAPILHLEEIEGAETHSEGYAGPTNTKQHDRSGRDQSGLVEYGNSKGVSQADNITLQNMRSDPRQETKPVGVQQLKKDTKWSLKGRTKSMSVPMGELSHSVPATSDTMKRGISSELRRKKSFGDFLRVTPRLEIGGGNKRSKIPDQDPSKSYFDFDDDKDTKGLWRAISLRETKLRLRT